MVADGFHPNRLRSEGFAGCLRLLSSDRCALEGHADSWGSAADIGRRLDLCLNRLLG